MQKIETKQITRLAVLIAIVLLMSFTPLGYIRTAGLEISFLMIPVTVGSITMGPTAGAILGGVFGFTSFLQCFGMSAFGATLLGINPFGTFITCFVARVLAGIFPGLIFRAFAKDDATKGVKSVGYVLSALAGPLGNTLFFMSGLVIFFYNTEFVQSFASQLGTTNPLAFVIAFVGIQGLVEAIVCTVVSIPVAMAINKYSKR